MPGWYVLAKICEALDKYIYKWTNNTVSGHTLKHLFAAIVPVCTIVMLTRRIVRIERWVTIPAKIMFLVELRNA